MRLQIYKITVKDKTPFVYDWSKYLAKIKKWIEDPDTNNKYIQ